MQPYLRAGKEMNKGNNRMMRSNTQSAAIAISYRGLPGLAAGFPR
jgi:hypothetical protein